jgi:hypothetical protein
MAHLPERGRLARGQMNGCRAQPLDQTNEVAQHLPLAAEFRTLTAGACSSSLGISGLADVTPQRFLSHVHLPLWPVVAARSPHRRARGRVQCSMECSIRIRRLALDGPTVPRLR